jgi:hypothetical protein
MRLAAALLTLTISTAPALATECETADTLAELDRILIGKANSEWGARQLESLKGYVGRAHPQRTAANDAIIDELKSLGADLPPPGQTVMHLSGPHAVDYNDKIDRYECEAAATFDDGVRTGTEYLFFTHR